MSAILNWTQKWGVSGLALYWDNSWAEGHPLGNLQLDAVGHLGLAQTGFITLISKELGDLALDLVGHKTIAGNLTILGAASNVIIVQAAEKRGYKEITLAGFVKIGGPLTLANAIVYWGYLEIIG